MKYKAVISDLDGTLLNSNHTISKYTQEVIKKVIEKGVKFYIATGR
ncbi:MAG: HAD family phosphatase, partial [Fusobacteriaceae bacterium]|nr:HAD family phosphatase [Fusobacteriaceae bacterium]